jgi:hypothetical protein
MSPPSRGPGLLLASVPAPVEAAALQLRCVPRSPGGLVPPLWAAAGTDERPGRAAQADVGHTKKPRSHIESGALLTLSAELVRFYFDAMMNNPS